MAENSLQKNCKHEYVLAFTGAECWKCEKKKWVKWAVEDVCDLCGLVLSTNVLEKYHSEPYQNKNKLDIRKYFIQHHKKRRSSYICFSCIVDVKAWLVTNKL